MAGRPDCPHKWGPWTTESRTNSQYRACLRCGRIERR